MSQQTKIQKKLGSRNPKSLSFSLKNRLHFVWKKIKKGIGFVLQYSDFFKKIYLCIWISPWGSTHPRISRFSPVIYVSYSSIAKEILAIVWICTYFRPYIFRKHFKIIIDCLPLVWLFNTKKLTRREYAYIIYLIETECKCRCPVPY